MAHSAAPLSAVECGPRKALRAVALHVAVGIDSPSPGQCVCKRCGKSHVAELLVR